MEYPGGCVCGGLRYVLRVAPGSLGDCHCIDCRRSAGAPYVTWGTVASDELVITHGVIRKIDHAQRQRSFAACCGTPVFFRDPAEPNSVDVTMASLDDPTPFAPQKSIWIEDKLPWVHLDPALPAFRQSSRTGPPIRGGHRPAE